MAPNHEVTSRSKLRPWWAENAHLTGRRPNWEISHKTKVEENTKILVVSRPKSEPDSSLTEILATYALSIIAANV